MALNSLAGLGQSSNSLVELLQLLRGTMGGAKTSPVPESSGANPFPTGSPRGSAPAVTGKVEPNAPDGSKFDKALGQAQKYGQIAQLLGGITGGFKGPPVPTPNPQAAIRPVPMMTPSVDRFRRQVGSGQLDLQSLFQLLAQGRR